MFQVITVLYILLQLRCTEGALPLFKVTLIQWCLRGSLRQLLYSFWKPDI